MFRIAVIAFWFAGAALAEAIVEIETTCSLHGVPVDCGPWVCWGWGGCGRPITVYSSEALDGLSDFQVNAFVEVGAYIDPSELPEGLEAHAYVEASDENTFHAVGPRRRGRVQISWDAHSWANASFSLLLDVAGRQLTDHYYMLENIPIGEGEVIHYAIRATADGYDSGTGGDAHVSLWLWIYEMNGDPVQLVSGGVYPPVPIPDLGTWSAALSGLLAMALRRGRRSGAA
jgi:hypothetical protein